MNVAAMIQMLSQLSPTAEVLTWDPDFDDWAPVTGAVHDPGTVRLYTDDDNAGEDDDGR